MRSKCNQNTIKIVQTMTITIFVTCSRYINASWILFKGYKQKFIASQVMRHLHLLFAFAFKRLHLHFDLNLHLHLMLIPIKAPIEDTIGDFWHCVAYHKVRFHQTLSPRPIAPKHYLDAQKRQNFSSMPRQLQTVSRKPAYSN